MKRVSYSHLKFEHLLWFSSVGSQKEKFGARVLNKDRYWSDLMAKLDQIKLITLKTVGLKFLLMLSSVSN